MVSRSFCRPFVSESIAWSCKDGLVALRIACHFQPNCAPKQSWPKALGLPESRLRNSCSIMRGFMRLLVWIVFQASVLALRERDTTNLNMDQASAELARPTPEEASMIQAEGSSEVGRKCCCKGYYYTIADSDKCSADGARLVTVSSVGCGSSFSGNCDIVGRD